MSRQLDTLGPAHGAGGPLDRCPPAAVARPVVFEVRGQRRTTPLGGVGARAGQEVHTSIMTALSAIFLHRREQFFAGFRTFCES